LNTSQINTVDEARDEAELLRRYGDATGEAQRRIADLVLLRRLLSRRPIGRFTMAAIAMLARQYPADLVRLLQQRGQIDRAHTPR
jgi:hypothetical protein